MVRIIRLCAEDKIVLRKPHPCGGDTFRVLRVGAEVRIVCLTCGRDMTMDRIKLEKSIRKVIPPEKTKGEEKQDGI